MTCWTKKLPDPVLEIQGVPSEISYNFNLLFFISDTLSTELRLGVDQVRKLIMHIQDLTYLVKFDKIATTTSSGTLR